MSLIPDDKKELLTNEFKEKLETPVRILIFTQEIECRFCSETRQLAQEMATLSDKITAEVYDFVADADKAKEYDIDKIPALAIIGKKDYGVRIYGIPYGYELQTLQEQALLKYEAAILNALEDVENALVAYAQDQYRRESLTQATQAAERAVDLALKQYSSGIIDFQDTLEAQRSLLSFQDQLAESNGAVTSNLISLYKALGGGWTSLMSEKAGSNEKK